jgi:protein-disulfide isomerase
VSRGYNARRKAKRQQARAAAEPPQRQSPKDSRRAAILLPALAIAAILTATAILGFGAGGSPSQKQIDQEVTAMLAGIPQRGVTLGSPDAPVTLQMFTDLECPTVKRFVESYLPSIISDWVRTGTVKLEYRSLQTDTIDEGIFFRQEEAARAAGRQNRMWNFALTFVRQQGQHFTQYANDAFLARIASQVPDLNIERWNRDREDPLLFEPIALGVHSAHARGLRYTPSFVMAASAETSSMQDEIKVSLEKDIRALSSEASGDISVLQIS